MIEESKWIDVHSASRQHSRVRWVELPEEKQPDDGNYDSYGTLVVDIKTHSNNDGIEYVGVPREVASLLIDAKENSSYDSVFGEYIASVVDNKQSVKLGQS
jgi:hypothetical protein